MLLKRKLNYPRDYVTNVINPYMWLIAWHENYLYMISLENFLDYWQWSLLMKTYIDMEQVKSLIF
jgi:hypothetical protein